jgi:hypothetical protein
VRAGRGWGGQGVLWTSAILALTLAQSPGEVEPLAETSAASSWAATPDQWFAMPEGDGFRWGFQNFGPRVGVQHRSQGYGYDSGYTSFDSFVPVYQSDFSLLTAFQGNLIVDNYGDVGLNLGLLQRQYFDSWDRIVGINSFYTFRKQGGNDFNQIGFGVETLGNRLDWRLNGYIPLGDDFEIPTSGGGVTDALFQGRSLLVNFIADKPLTGFDSEIGGTIPSTLEMFRAFIGFYNFNGDYSRHAFGVQGRLEARLQDFGVITLAVTNDAVFDTNVVVGAGFYLPGTKPRGTPNTRAAGRMAESVIRNDNIVIDRSATTEPVPARWRDGTLIDVVHVDSNAVGPATGSLAFPVDSLAAAQAAGRQGSLIFVRANSAFNGEGITLQQQQALLGEGIDHQIDSLYGSFLLPTVTPPEDIVAVPVIQNSPGNAVTMADSTQVSGFRISNPTGYGVFGNNLTDVVVDRLNISSAGLDGIRLTSVDGDVRVTDNFITSNAGAGVTITTSVAETQNEFVISDNTVLGQPGIGIDFTALGQSTNELVMERNLVRVSLGPLDNRVLPLIQLQTEDSSRLSARIEDNDIEDSFARDTNSPAEDPYYHQLVVNATENSRVDIGLINNRLVSDRQFFAGNPRNGSFGVDLNSSDLAVLRARLDSNSSSLNYAFSELYISRFQLEDTLSTNTGTLLYFPTENFFETIPDGTLELP